MMTLCDQVRGGIIADHKFNIEFLNPGGAFFVRRSAERRSIGDVRRPAKSPVLGLRIRGKQGGRFCNVNALAAGMDRERLLAARAAPIRRTYIERRSCDAGGFS